jgi:DNA-binding transcriptional ArsR family regulator
MIKTGLTDTDDRTILSGTDSEFISELSEFLDTLSSPVRLHILSFIGKNPHTIRQIAHEIGTSYENSKKHVTRLLELGIIRKEIGVSQDAANHGQPVFYYSLRPGALENLVTSLHIFSSITAGSDPVLHEKVVSTQICLDSTFPGSGPFLILKGGPDANRVYSLSGDTYRIGRVEPGIDSSYNESGILIPDSYRSVSRISGPHAWLIRIGDVWMLRDGESKGGTFLNGRRVSSVTPEPLSDRASIMLSPGPLGATLIFSLDSSVHVNISPDSTPP